MWNAVATPAKPVPMIAISQWFGTVGEEQYDAKGWGSLSQYEVMGSSTGNPGCVVGDMMAELNIPGEDGRHGSCYIYVVARC